MGYCNGSPQDIIIPFHYYYTTFGTVYATIPQYRTRFKSKPKIFTYINRIEDLSLGGVKRLERGNPPGWRWVGAVGLAWWDQRAVGVRVARRGGVCGERLAGVGLGASDLQRGPANRQKETPGGTRTPGVWWRERTVADGLVVAAGLPCVPCV